MNRIMDAIDKSELKRFCPKSCLICMPCLFRLLYSTGMRISEALSIKNGDVNIATDTILLTKTKNGKERLIPLNPELKAVLTQYMRYRDKMPVQGVGNPENHLLYQEPGNRSQQRHLIPSSKKYFSNVGYLTKERIRDPECMTCDIHLQSIPCKKWPPKESIYMPPFLSCQFCSDTQAYVKQNGI